MKKILFLFLFLAFSPLAKAQTWDLGIAMNGTNYQGDLVKPMLFRLEETNFSAGVIVRRHLNQRFGLRGNAFIGRITGDDKNFVQDEWRPQRGFSFKTMLLEFSLQGEFNLVKPLNQAGGRRFVVPYVFGGVGFVGTDPQVDFNTPNQMATDLDIWLDRRNVTKTAIGFPLGVGFDFPMGPSSSLGVEFGARAILSDYIDGVSEAGNPDKNDWYLLGSLQFVYHLDNRKDSDRDGVPDKKDKCPFVSGPKEHKGCPGKE